MYIRKLMCGIRSNIIVYILLGFISFLFVYFVSLSTSPFYPYYCGNDSAQFQVIGKAWADGLIPYLDLFDHKGPFIFFVNMFGYSMIDSSIGVMLLQIVFLFGTLMFLFKMTQLASSSKVYSVLAIILSVCVFHFAYSEGNCTEEYCLPFISACMYFQVKYFTVSLGQKVVTHKPFHALIYGLSLGVCLLTRVTNGIAICAGVLVICCVLIRNKKYINLLWNAFLFIVGFLLVFLPFAIYFAIHNVFYDFIYATLLFNIKYQANMSSWVNTATMYSWVQFAVVYFTAYIIFIVAALALRRHRFSFAFYCILCGILECYIFTSGALFGHYTIITLPQAIIFLNEVYLIQTKKRTDLIIKVVLSSLTVAFSIACLCVLMSRVINRHNEYKEYDDVGYEQLLNMIPEDEKNSFVAYGGDEFKQLYLLHDLTPYYKYFVIQEWHASFSAQTRDDIHQVFFNGNATWILSEGSTEVIQDILDSRYTVYAETERYRLYRLNEIVY